MPQKYKRKEGAKARQPFPPDISKIADDRAVNGEPLHSLAKEYGLSRNTLRRYTRKHNFHLPTIKEGYLQMTKRLSWQNI